MSLDGSAAVPRLPVLGSLAWQPALDLPELLAHPVEVALRGPAVTAGIGPVGVAAIDAELADTAAFCAAYDVPAAASANCVLVAGRREKQERWAAAIVLATTRADVNGVLRRRLDVRKISFAPMDAAVERSGMEYGGITPIGLPADWPILVDAAVAAAGPVVIGSGIRGSKLVIDGADLARLPQAELIQDLARPIG
jgi:prolyl-tRNA editing enzyme YbaK/EbsC (Cys-tRNA(Pro) deacylase)